MKKQLFFFALLLAIILVAGAQSVGTTAGGGASISIEKGDNVWNVLTFYGIDPTANVGANFAWERVASDNGLTTTFFSPGKYDARVYPGQSIYLSKWIVRLSKTPSMFLGEDLVYPPPTPQPATVSEPAVVGQATPPAIVPVESGLGWIGFLWLALGIISTIGLVYLAWFVATNGRDIVAEARARKQDRLRAERQASVISGERTPENAGPPVNAEGVTEANLEESFQSVRVTAASLGYAPVGAPRRVRVTSNPGWMLDTAYGDGVNTPIPWTDRPAFIQDFRNPKTGDTFSGLLLTGCVNSACTAVGTNGRRELARAGDHFRATPDLEYAMEKLRPVIAEIRRLNGGVLPTDIVVGEDRVVFNPATPAMPAGGESPNGQIAVAKEAKK